MNVDEFGGRPLTAELAGVFGAEYVNAIMSVTRTQRGRSDRTRATAPDDSLSLSDTSWFVWVDGYWRDGVWVCGYYRPVRHLVQSWSDNGS